MDICACFVKIHLIGQNKDIFAFCLYVILELFFKSILKDKWKREMESSSLEFP